MKYRIIFETDELIVITENGGVACIRHVEDMSEEPRIAVTDYYHTNLNEINPDGDVFEQLAEGYVTHKDWATTQYNSLTALYDALAVLTESEEEDHLVTEDLFTNLFPKK